MRRLKESLPDRQQITKHLGSGDFFVWECYGKGLLGRIQAWIFTSRLEAVVAFLESSKSEPRMILDVGCGPMFMAYPLLQRSTSQYVGVDILSSAALRKYKHTFKNLGMGSLEVIRASAQSLPFRNGTFDLLLCLDVLEHLEEPKKASAEMNRTAESGASILVSLPLENWLQKLSRIGFVWMRLLGEPTATRIGHIPIMQTPEYHYAGDIKSHKQMRDELTSHLQLLGTKYTPTGLFKWFNINSIHMFRKR